jgi:hypothetical protein
LIWINESIEPDPIEPSKKSPCPHARPGAL